MALADGGGGSSAATKALIPKKRSTGGSPLTASDYSVGKPKVEQEITQQAFGTESTFDVLARELARPVENADASLYQDLTKEAQATSIADRDFEALLGRRVARQSGELGDFVTGAGSSTLEATELGTGPAPRGYSIDRLKASRDRVGTAEVAKANKVDVEREMVESTERARRAGMRDRSTGKTEAMTLEEYQALNPKQRAAVDLNTMLAAAVKEDLSGKVETKGDADYRAQLNELGIKEGARYAPETVNLLDRINYEADGEKLGDFLKLRIGFTADDLDRLEPPRPGEGPDASLQSAPVVREGLQAALANSIMETRKDPERASMLFETQQKLTGTDDIIGMGPANPNGSINEQRNYFFQSMFEGLARKDEKGQKRIMDKIATQLTDEDMAAFNTYVQVRSRESKQYSLPLGTAEDVDYNSPKQLRAMLNLNG